jgi:hypothetical protein
MFNFLHEHLIWLIGAMAFNTSASSVQAPRRNHDQSKGERWYPNISPSYDALKLAYHRQSTFLYAASLE